MPTERDSDLDVSSLPKPSPGDLRLATLWLRGESWRPDVREFDRRVNECDDHAIVALCRLALRDSVSTLVLEEHVRGMALDDCN